MQEEVTGRTVTLIVNGAKMSEQVFEKAVKKFLEEIQKSPISRSATRTSRPLPMWRRNTMWILP